MYNQIIKTMKTILEQRNDIQIKIQRAESFTPHKVEYYKEMLKEFDFKHIDFFVYETLKVSIYWKGIKQQGLFCSVQSALNNINTISGGYNKYYSIYTPDAIINL